MRTVTGSVTIEWRPARYAVRWAEKREDVPPFDPARGGDPFAPVFDAGGLNLVQADRGGGKAPPDLYWEADAALTDQGEVPRVKGPNYPRLVRVDTNDSGEDIIPDDPHLRLAALTVHENKAGFMKAALSVAEVCGPLSFAEMDFSLAVWTHVAQEMQVHLGILEDLRLIRDANDGLAESSILLTPDDKQALHTISEPLDPFLASPSAREVEVLINSSANLAQFRAGLANLYWEEFAHHLRPYRHRGSYFDTTEVPSHATKLYVDVGVPGQLVVRCGSLGWSFYKLWKTASEAIDIRQCEGCGLLFQPRRSNAKHCSDACRVAGHRKRKRMRS